MPVRKASINNMGLIEPMQQESANNLRNATFRNISSLPMKTDPLVWVRRELAPLITKDLFDLTSTQASDLKEQLGCIKNDF
jgi:hypothetical protein